MAFQIEMSLSGRLFESRGGYVLGLREFLEFAARTGYRGVEIRYPQLPLTASPAKVKEATAGLAETGLSWVFGTVEGMVGEEALDKATHMLQLHQQCGCRFTRFTITQPGQIAWAQRFADVAARNGQRLVMQLHNGTLTDTVPHALDTLARIGRTNVGLAFEACHLMFAGAPRYAEAIEALRDHIFCVSLQNYKPASPADAPETTIRIHDRPYVRAWPGDPDGIDFAEVFGALRKIQFNGFATVIADALPDEDRAAIARGYLAFCRSLCEAS